MLGDEQIQATLLFLYLMPAKVEFIKGTGLDVPRIVKGNISTKVLLLPSCVPLILPSVGVEC